MKRIHLAALSLFLLSPVQAGAAAATKWLTYTDISGYYKINFPSSWQVLTKGNALVITSPGGPEERGVFGITLRGAGLTVEDAVTKEFQDPEKPSDLMQTQARLGNQPAVKVWGSKKGDPNIRIVEYYVQKGPRQFYVLFQAPHAAMPSFAPVFNAMIASMKFLK